MEFKYITLKGQDIETVFDDLAQLRISVFKAFPYLYEGSFEYEKDYLKTYSQAERAFLFAVYTEGSMIGATTCIPLADEMSEIKEPFVKAGFDIDSIFYFGESILLPEYRGVGLGHRFFDEREAHARSFGTYKTTCFCSVVRPENHPLKPEGYRPLDAFWTKRGYKKEPLLQSQLGWLDIGETESTKKTMVYWERAL